MGTREMLGLLSLLLVSGAAVWLYDRVTRNQALGGLAGNPDLTPADFGSRYFGGSELRAQLAAELRDIMARHLPYQVGRVTPDDAFVEDLRMDALDSMATVEFVLDVEERFGIKIPDGDAESIRNLRELADYVEGRLAGRAGLG